ncbi:MAG: Sec-independent protein translocase subunit TatA [Guyparkeria sp.]
MGFGGISIWQLLIILAIVLVLFGAKRLRNVGADLGTAIKGFKSAVREGEQPEDPDKLGTHEDRTFDNEVSAKDKDKA